MNDSFNELVYNWGFIVSSTTQLILGFINGRVRLLGTKRQKMIWPKIALLLFVGFVCVLASAYFDKRFDKSFASPSSFVGVFFFWTIAPYFAGIGMFAWTKAEFWDRKP
jgi:hypothetical protein